MQRVAVKGGLSNTFTLVQEVPQGSCLSPLQFTAYTSKLFQIAGRHLQSVHYYADDAQLLLAFSPNVLGDNAGWIKAMRDCFMDLR